MPRCEGYTFAAVPELKDAVLAINSKLMRISGEKWLLA
jgi:hypothetical protein